VEQIVLTVLRQADAARCRAPVPPYDHGATARQNWSARPIKWLQRFCPGRLL